ncbi:MAG: ATP synthase subunit I [Lachnospirales bacterium]
MFKLSITSKKMFYVLIALGLVVFGLSFAFISHTFAYGVAYGIFISVARIFLLDDSVNKALDRGPSKAKGYMTLHYILRFVLIGFAFVIAAKSDKIDIVGTFIGIIMLQPTAYISALLIKDDDLPINKDNLINIDEDVEGSVDFKEEIKDMRKTSSVIREMFK